MGELSRKSQSIVSRAARFGEEREGSKAWDVSRHRTVAPAARHGRPVTSATDGPRPDELGRLWWRTARSKCKRLVYEGGPPNQVGRFVGEMASD